MSLKRAEVELNRAHECKSDDHRSLIYIRLTLYELIEYLENQEEEK